MKIAILSDVHGNLPALQAVLADIERWQPERVIVAGDVVNRGPCSRLCLELIQAQVGNAGWEFLRGNHEDYLLHAASPEFPKSGAALEYLRAPSWSYQQDVRELVTDLASLPYQTKLHAPDGSRLMVMHGSLKGTRAGISPETDAAKLEELTDPNVDVFVCGHTHRAFQRFLQRGEKLQRIVNIGSVGLPFDGDPRAGYGQLIWQGGRWTSRQIRLEYDQQAAESLFWETGYLEGAGPLARVILRELQLAQPMLSSFDARFGKAILGEKISMEAAVNEWLAGFPD